MEGEEASATAQRSPGAKGAPLRGRFSRQLKRHPGKALLSIAAFPSAAGRKSPGAASP
ncbi:Hypothetical predicted protein [Podarcis lilfordi]|uniref:Uncharacterized protein n=1 Tax=Podarcis lilfordi TaxID=74358 RepID=A0AA35JS56_9SAUR|nr:Hypothetical predicted protein [Podarcis lilfordi]